MCSRGQTGRTPFRANILRASDIRNKLVTLIREAPTRMRKPFLPAFILLLCSISLGCVGIKNAMPSPNPQPNPPTPPAASLQSFEHVIFMLQENRTFDSYFGMLNPYRVANNWAVSEDGNTYTVDGIDDKLSKFVNVDDEGQSFSLFSLNTTCVDDMTSAWLESYGDVNRYDFNVARPILMDGFVHTAEGYAKSDAGDGSFTDLVGMRAMGYYDQNTLNYYYVPDDPGATPGDAPAQQGFAAQLGFRLPNLVISPFVRKHYVSHIPMDPTAVIKFVENRFIGASAHLTNRDAAQPNLLDFFDFTNVRWSTPPTPPTANAPPGNCDAASMP